jgi:hypothetical protein
VPMTAIVEVSGRRPDDGVATCTGSAFGNLQRRNPREIGLARCSERYGYLMSATALPRRAVG